jgi:sulfur carrier protein ThiS
MLVFIERTDETHEREFTGTAQALLEELAINPVTVIVAADQALIPLDTDISSAERIDILTIVSGG